MALPLSVLWGLQMRTAQKVGLACVFGVAMFVVIFDIIRTVISVRGGAVGAQSALWDILEATVAVIVSSLPSYRSVFISSKRHKTSTYLDLAHQKRLTQARTTTQPSTQPSIELSSAEKLVGITKETYQAAQGAFTGHNTMPVYHSASAFAHEGFLSHAPDPAHTIEVRQEFAVTQEEAERRR